MEDQGREPTNRSENASLTPDAPGRRWISRQRPALAIGVALALVIPGGAALASVVTGTGLGNPAKLAGGEVHSLLHASSRASAAASVYSTSTVPQSTVSATQTKKPLKCKKGQVKRTKKVHVKNGTKKVHGKTVTVFKTKTVTVCAPKKRVKAVHVRRPPSFTG